MNERPMNLHRAFFFAEAHELFTIAFAQEARMPLHEHVEPHQKIQGVLVHGHE